MAPSNTGPDKVHGPAAADGVKLTAPVGVPAETFPTRVALKTSACPRDGLGVLWLKSSDGVAAPTVIVVADEVAAL